MAKVLIIDDVHPALQDALIDNGHEINYLPTIKADEVADLLIDVEVLVLRSKLKITREIIENHAPVLKIIARAGAGVDEIDADFLANRNIQLLNAPEGNRQAVAEHVLGMLLSLLNNLTIANEEVRSKIWKREENRGIELAGKTVGIIGFGNNGKAFGNLLAAFGCTILYYDITTQTQISDIANKSTLEEIQKKAKILSFHTPLTPFTHNYLTKEFIESFQNPFWLLNASRGQVAPLENIVWGLKNNKILGAGLDVLENEKFNTYSDTQLQDFEYLVSNPKVIFSPHVAGWTHESYKKISEVLAQKIIKTLNTTKI